MNIEALLAVINQSQRCVHRPCSPFCQSDIESKFIIIRMIPVSKYPCLTGYSYPHRVRILVVCTLKFLVDSSIRKLQNRGISMKTSTSTISSKKLMPFYLEVPRPSYKTKSGDTCFIICLASVLIVEPVGTPLRLGVPWHFMGRPADERQRELTWRTC